MSSDSTQRRTAAWLMVIAVAITIGYANSFAGKFVFDDISNIVEESRLARFGTREWPRELGPRFLWMGSLAVDRVLWGGAPRNYHILNVLVHLTNAGLLFGLSRRLFRQESAGGWSPNAADGLACAAATLWAVHPLTTQAVTYIVQRGEAMSSCGVLAFLYAFVRSTEPNAAARRWLGLATLAFWFGMHCKEIAAVAPLIGALVWRNVLQRSWRELIQTHAVWVVTLLPAYWWCLRILNPAPSDAMGFGFTRTTPVQYLATQPGVVLHYLGLLLWPHSLCIDYRDWPLATTYSQWLPQSILVCGIIIVTVITVVRGSAWGVGLAACGLLLLPTSSIVPIADVAFEHRMYLPAAALIATLVPLVATSFLRGLRRWNLRPTTEAAFLTAIFAVLAVACTTRTIIRNADYSDPVRLWERAVAVRPLNWRAHATLGGEYGNRGRYAEALACFGRSLEISPNYLVALFGSGRGHWILGDEDKAIAFYRRAIAAYPVPTPTERLGTPKLVQCYADLGRLLEESGDHTEAIRLLRIAAENQTPELPVYRLLGSLLANQGADQEARHWLEAGLRLAPRWESGHVELAWLHATSADPSVAAPAAAAAAIAAVDPQRLAQNLRCREVAAAVAAAQGRYDEAALQMDQLLAATSETVSPEVREQWHRQRERYQSGSPYLRDLKPSVANPSATTRGELP